MAASPPATAVKRVALVAPTGTAALEYLAPLLPKITAARHRVQVLAPDIKPEDEARFQALGVEFGRVALGPSGFTLFPDRQVIGGLREHFFDWQPHVVLGLGPKPMTYAALAGRKAEVGRTVSIVEGIDGSARLDARIADAIAASDIVVCYNRDDARALKAKKLLPPGASVAVIPGAGVALDRHAELPLPPTGNGLVFLMIALLDEEKGVVDYCEAARIVKQRSPNTRFLLAGPPGTGTGAVTAQELETFAGAVEFLGAGEDPRALLADCHVFVYPSHREGMPQRVLQALAAGRPVITTDVAGCRETIDERVNGCVVPPGAPRALAAAVESFLKWPELIPPAAAASRLKAERRFDERVATGAMLAVLGL